LVAPASCRLECGHFARARGGEDATAPAAWNVALRKGEVPADRP